MSEATVTFLDTPALADQPSLQQGSDELTLDGPDDQVPDEKDHVHEKNDHNPDKDDRAPDEDDQVSDENDHVPDVDDQIPDEDDPVPEKGYHIADEDDQVPDEDAKVPDMDDQVPYEEVPKVDNQIFMKIIMYLMRMAMCLIRMTTYHLCLNITIKGQMILPD